MEWKTRSVNERNRLPNTLVVKQMVPNHKICKKILLNCGANLQAWARYFLSNLVEKLNAKKIELTPVTFRY